MQARIKVRARQEHVRNCGGGFGTGGQRLRNGGAWSVGRDLSTTDVAAYDGPRREERRLGLWPLVIAR